MSECTEIRWHGRAGQGVVTAGELLAEAALGEGKYFQAFPDYGPERMGAPIKSYTRIADEPIEVHYQILTPEVVIVVNPNLLGVVNVTEGLASDGLLIVNTPDSPADVRDKVGFRTGRVFAVDATAIAMEELKRDIPSTMMLGVIAKASGLVKLDSVKQLVREKLGEKLRPELVDANVRSLQRAYEQAVEG